MAWLEEHPTSGRFKICFRWGGRKHKKTVKTTSRKDAEAALLRFEENISLLERGRIELPPGADIGTFLLSDGKVAHKPKDESTPKILLLSELCDQYLAALSNGALEENSLATVRMHLKHFRTTLGERFHIRELTLADLQRHIDRRTKKKYRGRPLSPVTLKKELASFRACWNWGIDGGQLSGKLPSRGLKYPKADEKPPFQTWAEIERQIARGMSKTEAADLWECLFLMQEEIAELLEFVKAHAEHVWIYPAIAFAAHTGVRRSEVFRVRVADVDFEAETVLIHEKKRARGRRTTRRVPLSPLLSKTLKEWLAVHPGGQFLFCHRGEVARSKKRSKTTGHQNEKVRPSSLQGRMATVRKREQPSQSAITRDEAHDHFQRTLAQGKWRVLRGWHVLRHSFISCCACRGVDQRLIDEWVGHTTEEMRKRYRHLIPSAEKQAIRSVFGE